MAPTTMEASVFYSLPVESNQCIGKKLYVPFLQLVFLDSNTNYCNRMNPSGLKIGCVSLDQYKKTS
jgi:hypothetical protein